MKADLHLHTHHSLDGEFSSREVAEMCSREYLEVISITDHNSVSGIDEAFQVSGEAGIKLIPGIEIDCVFEGIDLHVLGYNIDWKANDFKNLEQSVLGKMTGAFPRMVELLDKAGITVDPQEVVLMANGRPPCVEQIAEVLITNPKYHSNPLLLPYLPGGARSDMPYINFYLDYFAQGKAAYVKIDFMPYEKTISLIRNHKGIPIIAHPGANLRKREEVIHKLIRGGALGLEAFNNYHDFDQIEYFAGVAVQQGLLLTCGSDFHGKNKPLIKPGGYKRLGHFEENVEKSIRILSGEPH